VDASLNLVINSPTVIFDVQGTETVVIDLATGHYFRLDSAGTPLWTAFQGGASIDSLLASCDNPDELRPVVDGIVQELLDLGLLRQVEDASAMSEPWHFGGFLLEHFTDLEDVLGLDPIHEVDPDKGWPHAQGV
jgi:hypothetical protein